MEGLRSIPERIAISQTLEIPFLTEFSAFMSALSRNAVARNDDFSAKFYITYDFVKGTQTSHFLIAAISVLPTPAVVRLGHLLLSLVIVGEFADGLNIV